MFDLRKRSGFRIANIAHKWAPISRHRRREGVVAAGGRLEVGDQGAGGFLVVFGDLQFDAAHREDEVRHGLGAVFVGEEHRDAAVFEHRF